MAIDPKNQKEINETSAYIQDTLISVSAKLGEALKVAINEAFDGADATVIKSIGNDLSRTFRSAAKYSDAIAGNNYKLNQGLIGTKEIEKQLQEIALKRDSLERKYLALQEIIGDEKKEEYQAALEALDVQKQQVEEDKERAEQIKKNMGSMGAIFSRLSKNKFFGSLLNAEEGLKAMRAEAAKGTKGFALMGKGIKAAFAGIEKASVVLFGLNQIVKIFRFFKDLAFGVSEQATNLSRALGTSKESGITLRQQFEGMVKPLEGTLYNVRNFVKSAQTLTTSFGYTRDFSEDILKTQSLLTERVKTSAETAGFLSVLMKATGQNTDEAFESMNSLAISMQQIDGIGIDIKTVTEDIAAAGAETASYYGFSTQALAKAVIESRKLGLNITQAKSVAKGLLDFESSISAQLELSVLTQKQFNFGNAMAKAAMGDIAGATQDVMKQMSQLTAEQRKSPVILDAMSKATGLSTEELSRQYALQFDINEQKKEYGRILESEGIVAARKFLIDRGIALAEVKEIENRISASEQFNEALNQAKDAFATLVNGGLLDRMILGITGLVEYLENSWFFKASTSAQLQNKKRTMGRSTDETVQEELKKMNQEESALIAKQKESLDNYKKAVEGKGYQSVREHGMNETSLKRRHEKELERLQERQLEVLNAIEAGVKENKTISVGKDKLSAATNSGKTGKQPTSSMFGGQ